MKNTIESKQHFWGLKKSQIKTNMYSDFLLVYVKKLKKTIKNEPKMTIIQYYICLLKGYSFVKETNLLI